MKKVALLLYDQFCNFEISVALEMLAMAGTPIAIFAKDLKAVKSEEGFTPEDLSQMIGWDDNIASPIKQG
ncbi:hypothetical protein lbkm_0854 [Lachnospiraceae bacterium KM106-2]|nr:hypothetical protein lbkm_0854 [Lachnospiraceae bacterium KM106-2]